MFVKYVPTRASLLTLLIGLLWPGVLLPIFAQANCQVLQTQMRNLISQHQDAESALHDSESCSGATRAAACRLRIAALAKQITQLQQVMDTNKCPPDPQTSAVTMAVCCGWRVESHPRLVADINGDGKADIVGFSADGAWESLSNGQGGFAEPVFGLANLGYNQSWRVDKHIRVLADLNGDKRPALVGFGDAGVSVALASPLGGWQPLNLVIPNFGVNQEWSLSKHVRVMADVSGDRKADVVAFGDAGVWTALSTGNGGFTAPALVVGNFGYNQGWRVEKHVRLMADVNGDGRQDIVAFGDDGVWLALADGKGGFSAPAFVIANFGVKQGWDPSKHVRLMADINGDGKADIVAFGDDGVWTALSTGTGFAAPQFVIANLGYNQSWRVDKHVRLMADVNGDGRQDIVAFGDDGVWLALADGSGGFGPASFVIANFGVNQSWDSSKHIRTVADVNGDGKADIVAIGDDGVWAALSVGSGFAPPAFVLADFAYGGAMDVMLSGDSTDDNGFPRNPVWRQPQPDPCGPCPCGNGNTTPQAWNATPGCTIQSLHTNTHTGLSSLRPSAILCSAGGATGLNGQMNYFPVEYEGTVAWGGHSNSVYDDDDYFMTVSRPDQALQTYARDGVHFEFDSEETVDNWDNTKTWWDDFHHNAVDKDDQTARSFVDGKQVIVIGMVALDLEHSDHHSELHPAYAVFVRMPGTTTSQEKVSFFVRNWGNGGFCGPNQEEISQNTIRVRIRHPWGTGFSLGENVWVYGDDSSEYNQQSWSYQQVADGLLLTFSLREASKHCGFVGDLTINWGTPLATLSTVRAPVIKPAPPEEDEDGDAALKAKIAKLDAPSQALLYSQLKALNPRPKALPKRGIAGGATPVPPGTTVKAGRTLASYSSKLIAVEDAVRLAQKDKQQQLVIAFLKARGIE